MAAPIVEIRKVDGKWQVGARRQAQPPHHRRRPRCSSPARPPATTASRPAPTPTGTQGVRHDQQLRRRRHALGHLRHGRGEHPRLFRRRAARRPSGGRQLQAPRRAGRRLRLGQASTTASTSPRSRTSRTASAGSSRSTSIDPNSTPKKRTALGRFKHEGAESIVAKDGRVVFYLGDDERFDYVYKFVTAGTFNPDDRAANMDLLDEGTLYVAKFAEDGTRRLAAAGPRRGPADRRERLRQPGRRADRDAPRRRPARRHQDGPAGGHPAERRQRQGLCDADQQHQAQGRAGRRRQSARRRTPSATSSRSPRTAATSPPTKGTWEVLLKCGDPSVAEVGATFSTATTANGWFGMPDNCAVDCGRPALGLDRRQRRRRPPAAPTASGRSTPKARRARTSKLFFRVPVGAEMCGPLFTPDDADGLRRRPASGRRRRGLGRLRPRRPTTRTCRPAGRTSSPTCRCARRCVAITRQGGGKIAV